MGAEAAITCARSTATGIELRFEVPDGVSVGELALEREVGPLPVPAGELCTTLVLAAAGVWISRRLPRAAGLLALTACAAPLAFAAVLIGLQAASRGYLDTSVQQGQTYTYRLLVNGGAHVSGRVAARFDAAEGPPCMPPTATPSPTRTWTPAPPTATRTSVPPTATRTPVLPTATPAGQGWLSYVNEFRSAAGVGPLTGNAGWSAGAVLHSRYMVKNDYIGHDEDPAKPWYTPEGQTAARNGNVMVTSWSGASDSYAIDLWMTGPFHAVGIIDPQLQSSGFGSFREASGGWAMAGTLDVLRGLGGVPGGTVFPLPYPKNGGETWLLSYGGSELPDPLSSCPGYAAPSGPPIILQLGSGSLIPNVTAHSFAQGAVQLAHCVFDETNYVNASYQSLGRAVLNSRDAVVLMPRQPLAAGKTYTASITSGGTAHTWSFQAVARPQQLDVPPGSKFAVE